MSRKNHIIKVLCIAAVFSASSARADLTSQILPSGWIDVDIGNKLINQNCAPNPQGSEIQFIKADPRAGYRKVQTRALDLGLGVYGGWFVNSDNFATSLLGFGG